MYSYWYNLKWMCEGESNTSQVKLRWRSASKNSQKCVGALQLNDDYFSWQMYLFIYKYIIYLFAFNFNAFPCLNSVVNIALSISLLLFILLFTYFQFISHYYILIYLSWSVAVLCCLSNNFPHSSISGKVHLTRVQFALVLSVSIPLCHPQYSLSSWSSSARTH